MLHHTPDPASPPNLSLRRDSLFRHTAACGGGGAHTYTHRMTTMLFHREEAGVSDQHKSHPCAAESRVAAIVAH